MPKSFENGVLNRQPINQGLVQSVRLVGEYRGTVVRRSRALRELSAEGVVRCVGRGRDATWEKLPAAVT